MSRTTYRLTAIIEREDNLYVALCPELDIASQDVTVEEARSNLGRGRGTLFEVANPAEVQNRLRGGELFVTQMEVAVG
jgi:predicted RNase H-like HicB family nuclease